ncbi:MAG: endopeptidase La [Dehalococcoidia bacterium]|nr:endopeptidase La [Dehalococcoidia bacterium]
MSRAKDEIENQEAELQIPQEVAVLPSGEVVIYPEMMIPLAAGEEKMVKLIDDVLSGDKILGLFAQRSGGEGASADNIYNIGTATAVARMFKMPDGSIRAFLQGMKRIKIKKVIQTEPYMRAQIKVIEEKFDKTPELEALTRNLTDLFQKIVSLSPNLPEEIGVAVINISEPGRLADFVAAHINLNLEEKQGILEELNVRKRLKKVTGFINREREILEIGSKIQSEIKGEFDRAQRQYYLREQLKAIQRELGEADEQTMEIDELRKNIEEAQLPPEALKEAERELDRLSKMPPQAAEYSVAKTYLDWVTSLPWAKSTEESVDIKRAAEILDEDHYDLEKVKERILEYLAVRKLKQDMKGPILCFVGPPGTGKTSIGQSIARALGRKFVRMSLGGVRDEAEIRGHRRTYVGALPGRIIQGIRRAGSNDPVFMLDEIDKVGADFRGDPSAALLEVLDPEQNHAFFDHYLDVPFDLSKVMFITTANLEDPILPALRDRMEVLELPGYTELEKLNIAKKFLITKQLRENGLSKDRLKITDDAILAIVRKYTREAGLRNLEREIGTICRKVARQVIEDDIKRVKITPKKLKEFLGTGKFKYDVAEGSDEIGVATGLAWTQAGGDVLFVEASLVPGKGNLTLTGKLGDVMQESARAALTYTRAHASSLGVKGNFYETKDIHIHVPAGAIPKDGPSAGITMTVALASAISGKPVKKNVAMTGEITLRGKVLPVGGIKEKVLAAHRAGVTKVILPKDNEKDLDEIPQQIKDELQFMFVKQIDEVLKETM